MLPINRLLKLSKSIKFCVIRRQLNSAFDMSVDVAQAFKDNEIVPGIARVGPTKLITVTYPSGASVQLGNELTPTQVKDIPKLEWDADENAFYTLLMFDPDAPTRIIPVLREVRHWTVVNIPGNAVDRGETTSEYIGCGPPKYTGKHRYVFLIFKQPDGKIDNREPFTSKTSRSNRLATSAEKFRKKYNFQSAEFGNFFQAKYDDYVPILHKQLGGK